MKNFAKDNLKLGIIGAGIMGRGIAQIASIAGIEVILADTQQVVCDDAVVFIHNMLDRAVEKGRLQENEAVNSKQKISVTTDLKNFVNCDVVIEAIVENLEIKQSVFRELEEIVRPDCILASNTSSFSITSIAAVCKLPGRLAGFHFFNPVPLMKLVEIIKGVKTNTAVIQELNNFASRLGHSPVMVSDSPGFLVNHAGRGMVTEGLRLLYENVTDPQTVDEVMRDCAGFRMGPFELMDLTGLDVTFPATKQIYQQYFQEPRLKPTPLQERRFVAGLYGRKTGEGFYHYVNNEKIVANKDAPIGNYDSYSFWVTHNCEQILRDSVVDLLKLANCKIDTADKAGPESIAIVMPLGWDISTITQHEGLDAAHTIGIDSLFSLDKRIVLMTNPATSQNVINASCTMFVKTGRSISLIRDSAGFITQRMIATIVNIACDIAQQGIAKPEDIDKGARLGLGYPQGPLELGNKIGTKIILTILENMFDCYGDMRYRPSPWLRRRAQLGLSLLHVE